MCEQREIESVVILTTKKHWNGI